MISLKTEHAELKTKYGELSNKYKQCVLRLEHVIASGANFKFYTSFPNYATFKAFFNYLQPACNSLMYAGSCNTEHVEATQQKHGRPRVTIPRTRTVHGISSVEMWGCWDLTLLTGSVFHTHQFSSIETTWLGFLYHRMRALPIWATREHVQETMPQAFKDSYPNTRVIIDCTEIYIEMPTSFRSQSATYSSYKNHNTAKGLIGISPAGYPTFISELYTGSRVINRSQKIVAF